MIPSPSMGRFGKGLKFTLEDAREMMLRYEDSKLRVIAIGNMQYKVRSLPSGFLRFLLILILLLGEKGKMGFRGSGRIEIRRFR